MATYTPLWNIADEYEIMWPQTMQDLYFSIRINIFSIAFGVLGFMTFIDISLDAISMITIAMSVGFSVDFAAHVSYAYMTEKRLPKKDENIAHAKLRYTLGTVGWPIIQISMARESGGTASVAPTRNGTSQSNQNQINQAENEAETSTHQNEQQTSQSSNSEPKKSKGARKSGENSSIPGTSDGETTASGNAYQHTDLKALQSGNKGALKKQPIQQQQAEENHEEENPDNELEELCVDERMDREQSEELIEEDRHSQSAQMQGPFKLQSSLGDYQFMIALADAVSLEPCIYDPRDEHYGNRMASVQFRTHVWQSISEQINFTGTIQQLQTHWKRLRDKYVRWKKKTEREQRNSDPMDVEMMERMHWLDEYCGEASARGQSILRQQLVHSTESMNADTYYDNHNMSIAQDLMISGYQTPRNISIVQGAQSSRLSHQNESPSGSASGAHSTSAVTTSSSNGSGYILLQPNSNRPVRLVPLAEASGIISNVNDAGTSGAKTMTTLSGNNSGNVHHSAITNKGQRIIITGGSSATKSAHNSEPTITVTDSGSVPGRAAMTQQPKKEPVQLHHHGTMTMLVDTTTCYQNGSGQKMFRLLSVPNTPSNPIEYESPAGSTSSGSAGPPPVKKRLIPYRPNNASNHQYTPTSHQNVATTSAQHSQSIVLTNSGHAARNSSGSGAGQRILIPQQTISQSHSSGGLSQLNEDMILDEADSLQDRSIVMDQDEDSALLGESPLLSSMMIGGGHEQLRGQTSNEAEQHHRLAVQQQQRLVANSPSVGAGPSATVGYQSQYDADLAFQQLISSHLSRLADDEKAVMKMNIQRILLDARFGPGTCIRIIQDEETELPTNNVVAHELVPNSH
ncbi:hypothetical protein WR25_01225 isoform A [Diploscapter pachys]|uniref:MADF domain-containing protein n=1 Tax=Diploscapter pachys TaxID=2018661 RepID=A0A2A2KPN1_9BILA|nr:hypothetical protein WR25_01225 isoform A [Diploscapter pachys]